jgi:predicted Zn finger-like uncharacterized protein
MSLATRCTHCGTIFKVVQDQLKVSEGWVRCGRCNEVFNAMPALFDLDEDTQAPHPATQAALAAPADPEHEPQPQPQPDWTTTQPGSLRSAKLPGPATPLTMNEDDLTLDPEPIAGTTDFELDTAIAVHDNTPLEDVLSATSGMRPQIAERATAPLQKLGHIETPGSMAPGPQHWEDEPQQETLETASAEASTPRYLIPSERVRRATIRRGSGPEFADAQFPSDAMIDAEVDWAFDFGPSVLETEAAAAAPAHPPHRPQAAPALSPDALRVTASAPPSPLRHQAPSPDDIANPASRFASDFEPELAMQAPRERPGQSGTRGRAKAEQAPEFLKRAQRKAFWRHPAMRAALSGILVTLLLTLTLQLVHQFRDLIAAWHPASRPLLTQWCEVAGCKLAPALRLEALQVDNLELVRTSSEGPDRYRLTVVVRNQAGIDLAWPHVDLTLTDDNGAVIARRVFAPNDAQWLDTADAKAKATDAAKAPPPAAPSQRSTTLQWRLKVANLHPAGYTAELFYP